MSKKTLNIAKKVTALLLFFIIFNQQFNSSKTKKSLFTDYILFIYCLMSKKTVNIAKKVTALLLFLLFSTANLWKNIHTWSQVVR